MLSRDLFFDIIIIIRVSYRGRLKITGIVNNIVVYYKNKEYVYE